MVKEGDILIGKGTWIEKDKEYIVDKVIDHKDNLTGQYMVYIGYDIDGKRTDSSRFSFDSMDSSYLWDHFYTKKQIRQMKLDKINGI